MFNENIDNKACVPSTGVFKLWFVLNDIYKNSSIKNELTPIELQQLMNNYGDKYTHIDKIIMLIYGVSVVNSFDLNEEKIAKTRINTADLTDKETSDDITELITPQIVLDTNIGELVIGYDYAYVKKQLFTPNVDISGIDKLVSEDERVVYNINYPYIYIDNHNEKLKIIPPISYENFIMLSKPEHDIDYYTIDINTLKMVRVYDTQPFDISTTERTDKVNKALDIDGYTHDDNYIIRDGDYLYMVQHYKSSSDDKCYQIVVDNRFNVYNIYWQVDKYICEKRYLDNPLLLSQCSE